MKTRHVLLILFLVGLIYNSKIFSQNNKKIHIEKAGFGNRDEANHPGAYILTRDDKEQIRISHQGAVIWCDQAIHYQDENFIEAYGHVTLKQGDTINMNADYVEYSGITQLAYASGNVVLTDPTSTVTTDTLYFDRLKQQSFYNTGGTVVRDTSGTITSKIGRYYMKDKKYQFVTKVKLVNDNYLLETSQLDYYTINGHAYMYGPSTITGETSKIYSERGFYDTKKDLGYFVKNSRIDYDNRIIQGDSMYYNRSNNFASASNNIKITDTLNNSIIKGHYAEVYKNKDSVFITKRALAITVQENDSIYIHANTLMVTGKPENRITRAYYNAKMYKSDMSGKADSIHITHKKGVTQLINLSRYNPSDKFAAPRKPIIWHVENQMTGDTINIYANPKTEKLDSLIAFNNAFLINKDTIGGGYNQISGMRLIGFFNNENELEKANIEKNAESIFYARNEENELIGIEKSKSGSIEMFFENREITELKKINQVIGNLYPESLFPKNARLLRDFDWRNDERPKSIEDLFIDDAPLQLPIIKGLDPYVPQNDFFDDELLERIKTSETENNNKSLKTNVPPSKAARRLPKKIKLEDPR